MEGVGFSTWLCLAVIVCSFSQLGLSGPNRPPIRVASKRHGSGNYNFAGIPIESLGDSALRFNGSDIDVQLAGPLEGRCSVQQLTVDICSNDVSPALAQRFVSAEAVRVHEDTTMRCVQRTPRYLKILSGRVEQPHYEFAHHPRKNNSCHTGWIDDDKLFGGISQLIFVGDSTILRDYMWVKRASELEYATKVMRLDSDELAANITLSSHRNLTVRYFRLLHLSRSATVIDQVFDVADERSVVVFAFGPHDTSWLVFRTPMPSFRKSKVGQWGAAKAYWVRFATQVANQIATRLRGFDRELPSRPTGSRASRRPVVLIREQFLPNCAHPKYARSPLITRCTDLLYPIVVPYYRMFLRTLMNKVNVPVVSMDPLMPPCRLKDAGHLVRWCKRYELQLIVQAYRTVWQSGVVQGFRRGSVINTIQSLYGSEHFAAYAARMWVDAREDLFLALPANPLWATERDSRSATVNASQSSAGEAEERTTDDTNATSANDAEDDGDATNNTSDVAPPDSHSEAELPVESVVPSRATQIFPSEPDRTLSKPLGGASSTGATGTQIRKAKNNAVDRGAEGTIAPTAVPGKYVLVAFHSLYSDSASTKLDKAGGEGAPGLTLTILIFCVACGVALFALRRIRGS